MTSKTIRRNTVTLTKDGQTVTMTTIKGSNEATVTDSEGSEVKSLNRARRMMLDLQNDGWKATSISH